MAGFLGDALAPLVAERDVAEQAAQVILAPALEVLSPELLRDQAELVLPGQVAVRAFEDLQARFVHLERDEHVREVRQRLMDGQALRVDRVVELRQDGIDDRVRCLVRHDIRRAARADDFSRVLPRFEIREPQRPIVAVVLGRTAFARARVES